MSALRKSGLKRGLYFGAAAFLPLALVLLDSFRPPAEQLDRSIYVHAVHGYQTYLRPLTSRFVRCRFIPSCSEYSIEAVNRLGIRKGLVLTANRLSRCRKGITPGTIDPVPSR